MLCRASCPPLEGRKNWVFLFCLPPFGAGWLVERGIPYSSSLSPPHLPLSWEVAGALLNVRSGVFMWPHPPPPQAMRGWEVAHQPHLHQDTVWPKCCRPVHHWWVGLLPAMYCFSLQCIASVSRCNVLLLGSFCLPCLWSIQLPTLSDACPARVLK